ERGAWPIAIERFQAARHQQVERDDTAGDVYSGLGDSLYAVGQFDAAIWSYGVVLNIDPERAWVRDRRARARACAGWRPPSPEAPSSGPTPRLEEEPSTPPPCPAFLAPLALVEGLLTRRCKKMPGSMREGPGACGSSPPSTTRG